MARTRGTKNELVKCPYCGEMYSVTYKHCPFCNEDGTGGWDELEEYDDEPRRSGGKRLAGGSGGRGRGQGCSVRSIVGTLISLALIIAAVCIVTSIVRSLLGKSKPPKEEESPVPTISQSVAPTGTDEVDPTPTPEESATVTSSPVPTQPAQPQVTTPSVDIVAPTGFALSAEDLSFFQVGEVYNMRITYTPANARGDVTWKSSNPNVASVSWNGVVTAVGPGTATITATVAGAGEKSCIFRCRFEGSAATSAPASTPSGSGNSGTSSSGLTLSREDFTLAFAGDKWPLKVSGTSSNVSWTSSNAAVATVAADGTVTAVGKGTCTITATVDGQSLKCIVRCSWKDE